MIILLFHVIVFSLAGMLWTTVPHLILVWILIFAVFVQWSSITLHYKLLESFFYWLVIFDTIFMSGWFRVKHKRCKKIAWEVHILASTEHHELNCFCRNSNMLLVLWKISIDYNHLFHTIFVCTWKTVSICEWQWHPLTELNLIKRQIQIFS